MRVLVLGAYGLIGGSVVDRLVRDGHAVVGLGRDPVALARGRADVEWVGADLSRLTTAEAWVPLLDGIDCVVNAAGALQDGARDRVAAVQRDAMIALYRACEARGVRRVVQVSAVGAEPAAQTDFLRTKAEADAALMASALEWVVLRPGLVLAPQAYGGTALLRALASVPGAMPVVFGSCPVQTVSIDDVAGAVADAVSGTVPSGTLADLVEDERHRLSDVVRRLRAWLGYSPVPALALPDAAAGPVATVADLLGRLGWRSPLRRNAMASIRAGVVGDPARWRDLTGRGLSSLDETLAAMPATVQERWFARLWLLRPLALATLAGFWIASGAVGLVQFDAAAAVLTGAGMSEAAARSVVVAGALADVALGGAVLVRRWCRGGLLGMLGLSTAYLAAAAVVAPVLWADPLGPMLKVVPGMVLTLFALAVLEDR